MIALWIALGVLPVVLIAAGVCFWMTFYVRKRPTELTEEEYLIPGKIYEPYYPRMREWNAQVAAMPHEALSIRSADGLTLRGRYFELTPDSPVELLFHGYRGRSERDMCGAVERCFQVGHSAVLIDQLKGTFQFIKKNYAIINKVCGSLLIAVGVLMATGLLTKMLNILN